MKFSLTFRYLVYNAVLMNHNYWKRAGVIIFIVSISITAGYLLAGLDLSANKTVAVKQQVASVSLAMAAKVDPDKLYEITDVVDGDTFKVKIDGKQITVRLLGINTPEVVDPRKPVECFGPEASAEMKALLKAGKVGPSEVKLTLNPNREKIDKYNRLLAYAYLADGLFINEYMVKEGFAREYTYGKAYQYQKEFKEAEKTAKDLGKGLWTK